MPLGQVVRRFVEHGHPALGLAFPAVDPDVAHATATGSGLSRRSAEARCPADPYPAGSQFMTIRANIGFVFEQIRHESRCARGRCG